MSCETLTFDRLGALDAAGCEMTAISREELQSTAHTSVQLGLGPDDAEMILRRALRGNPALTYAGGDVSALAEMIDDERSVSP